MTFENLYAFVGFLSSLFTITASGIAIYLFFFKRKAISSVFKLLLNYSYQLTLSELKEKIERINDYKVEDSDGKKEIINILNEIMGQVRGNQKLKEHLEEIIKKVEKFISNERSQSEPNKRALVAELRERVRHLNVKNIDDLIGE